MVSDWKWRELPKLIENKQKATHCSRFEQSIDSLEGSQLELQNVLKNIFHCVMIILFSFLLVLTVYVEFSELLIHFAL